MFLYKTKKGEEIVRKEEMEVNKKETIVESNLKRGLRLSLVVLWIGNTITYTSLFGHFDIKLSKNVVSDVVKNGRVVI